MLNVNVLFTSFFIVYCKQINSSHPSRNMDMDVDPPSDDNAIYIASHLKEEGSGPQSESEDKGPDLAMRTKLFESLFDRLRDMELELESFKNQSAPSELIDELDKEIVYERMRIVSNVEQFFVRMHGIDL